MKSNGNNSLTRLNPHLAGDKHYIYKLFYVLYVLTYYEIKWK